MSFATRRLGADTLGHPCFVPAMQRARPGIRPGSTCEAHSGCALMRSSVRLRELQRLVTRMGCPVQVEAERAQSSCFHPGLAGEGRISGSLAL